ncbi:LOW QUALITY PROTEIN: hypothetical protein Cgig2_025771 [Carnegiea gigantea]|uniref:Uncharacterized protein n=1 Tax=Carnegiea gigantea TaxID=171969 RepID=A0A9Q1GYH3_9CARY|nr:LOW QUALITY PROTEIN: hypothetical protein Cgig2_025771 [Carnegiea gigantea]
MADAITRQVSEQRAIEVAGSARPLPPPEHPLVHEGEPSHQSEWMSSLRPMERSREVAQLDWSDRLPTGQQGGRTAVEPVGRSTRGTTVVSATASTPYATHSRWTAWLEEPEQTSRPRERPRVPSTRTGSCSTPPRDEECSTEVVATIAGAYVEEITRSVWKAQLRSAQQEVNPIGMIRLPVRFDDKTKFKSLKADFLVVDIPTTYNVMGGQPSTG